MIWAFSPICAKLPDSPRGVVAPVRDIRLRKRESRIVTPEELERERQASRERRQKAIEARRADQAAAAAQPAPTGGLSRAQRLKLQDDEYVPPQD